MAVTQKVTLYNNKFTVPPVINAVQNDTDRQVEAYFGDFTLQVGMTGKLSFIRSDGTHYEVSATLNTGANTATAELDQALTQAGVTQAQLKITDSGNVGSTFTFMIKVQPDVAGALTPQQGVTVIEAVELSEQALATAEEAVETAQEALDSVSALAPVITDTASGSIATFSDGADSYPLKECVVNIEAIQGGSGDPSPTNVRPITGWSSAKVTRAGKNILPITASDYTYESGIVTHNNDDGSVSFSGTANANTWAYMNVYGANYRLPVGDYILNSGIQGAGTGSSDYRIQMSVYDRDTNRLKRTYYDSGNGRAVTINENESEAVYVFIPSGKNMDGITLYPMLRLATDSDATFEGYKGQTVTISLGSTRYGGVLNATTGKLTVTHKMLTVSNMDIYYTTSGLRFITTAVQSDLKKPSSSTVPANAISSAYKCLAQNIFDDTSNNYCFMLSQGGYISIRNKDYTDVATFKSARGTDQLLFELNTPIEVDLTPTEITTLLGINNIWADCGDIEVEYCADTKKYIQKVISALA